MPSPSTISAATAPDVEILTWADEHASVLITNDLDFSAILAASGRASPSVVQIRTQDLLSDVVVSIVANALDAHREGIERGALLSIDEAGTRVRVLRLRRSQDLAVAPFRRDCDTAALPSLVARVWTPERGNRVGKPELGSTVPPAR